MQGFRAMEVGFCSSELGKIVSPSHLEFLILDTLLPTAKSLMLMTGALLGAVCELPGLPGLTAIENRFPVDELRKKERPGPENKDGSDTEDDDDEDDAVEDQDDDDDEDFSGGEAGEDDDEEGDPEDEAETNANGEGGSDDDDDEDGDDDDDDEDGEEEEEDEEEEDDQPPAKKRK